VACAVIEQGPKKKKKKRMEKKKRLEMYERKSREDGREAPLPPGACCVR
jgi:hypothetical protein